MFLLGNGFEGWFGCWLDWFVLYRLNFSYRKNILFMLLFIRKSLFKKNY